MRNNELCYWLQGYLELRGSADKGPLTKAQLKTIRAHVALVKKVEQRLDGFSAWLDVVLDLLKEKGDECDAATHSAIERKLSATFKHDIDGGYTGDQNDFNSTHGPGDVVYRC